VPGTSSIQHPKLFAAYRDHVCALRIEPVWKHGARRANERPQPSAEAFLLAGTLQAPIGSLEHPTADVDAARPEVGEHGLPAASADVEPRTEVMVTVMMAPVTMTMMMMMMTMTMMSMTMTVAMSTMAVSAMPTTVAAFATSRSRGNSGNGQSERGDSCERDLAKHFVFSILLGVIA
jgi:hypothetical protein